MRLFNALQLVVAFMAWPLLIQWLDQATFRGAGVAFWSAIVIYVASFIAAVASTHHSLETIDNG